MKKVIALMSIIGLLTFTNLNGVMAQDKAAQPAEPATEQVDEQTADSAVAEAPVAEEPETVAAPAEETKSFHQVLKEKYIQGGAGWMTPVLLCLIFGLALVIERILYLNLATTNVEKLLKDIEGKVSSHDYEGAKAICRDTKGPVASIFYQGLDRINNGLNSHPFAEIATNLRTRDPYMVLADFDSYRAAQAYAAQCYSDRMKFAKMSLNNIAGAGIFSADRAVTEYAKNIWHL